MLCHSQDIINRDTEDSPSDLEPEKLFSSHGQGKLLFCGGRGDVSAWSSCKVDSD